MTGDDEHDGGHDRGNDERGAGARGSEESTRTVLIATAANLAIAVAKGVAAILTGSAAMWAETLHSAADTGNEVLLFIGLRRSRREPDRAHPFGWGQERYFWSFLAALGIFLIGGVLSIADGVRGMLLPEPLTSPWIGIGVLLVSGVFESISWLQARRQLRRDARERHRSMPEHLSRVSDPSAATVFLEDSAALIGIALAMIGMVLHLVTGSGVWDGVASVCIGILLVVVAWQLSRRSKALLIDESAPDDVMERIRALIEDNHLVDEVHEVNAIYVGPAQLLVTAQVSLPPRIAGGSGREVLDASARLREELLRAPAIADVALTVTDGRPQHVGSPDAAAP